MFQVRIIQERVIQVKGAKFILIGTYMYPFRIFLVSNIFTGGGVFMIRTKEKHGKLESALWKLFDDYYFPLIFIFQSALTRIVVADYLWYRTIKAKQITAINKTERIRLGVTSGLICAANRRPCTIKTFENLCYLLMTAAAQFYLVFKLQGTKVFYKVKE